MKHGGSNALLFSRVAIVIFYEHQFAADLRCVCAGCYYPHWSSLPYPSGRYWHVIRDFKFWRRSRKRLRRRRRAADLEVLFQICQKKVCELFTHSNGAFYAWFIYLLFNIYFYSFASLGEGSGEGSGDIDWRSMLTGGLIYYNTTNKYSKNHPKIMEGEKSVTSAEKLNFLKY